MLYNLLALAPVALATVLPREPSVNYDGFEALRVYTGGDSSEVLKKLSEVDYEQWNQRVDDHIDLSLSKEAAEKVKELGLKWDQMHKDLGEDIRSEKVWDEYKGAKSGALPDDSWFDTYHPYDDHVQFWKDLQSTVPSNSELSNIGKSYEERDIFAFKLFGNAQSGGPEKQAVIWHGTVHAREWITPAALEYILYQMVEGFASEDPLVTDLLSKYDFYIVPFVNPDGFIYSQEVDRLWRKNRRPPPRSAPNQSCFGVDVNRNWPFQWNPSSGGGGSTDNPCAQTYRGTSAGSEPENVAVRNHIDNIAESQKIKLYSDWHSYGLYFLSPFGYSCTELAENSEEHDALAQGTAEVIESVYGQSFTVGPTCETLYAVNGGSLDYVKAEANGEFAYAIELRDQGRRGFVLPPSEIRPSGEEMWEGMKYMLSNA